MKLSAIYVPRRRLTGPIGEIDFDVAGDADVTAVLIVSVEGDVRDRADDLLAAMSREGFQRRLDLGLDPHERERHGPGTAGGDRLRHAGVERERHVDALHVVAV